MTFELEAEPLGLTDRFGPPLEVVALEVGQALLEFADPGLRIVGLLLSVHCTDVTRATAGET